MAHNPYSHPTMPRRGPGLDIGRCGTERKGFHLHEGWGSEVFRLLDPEHEIAYRFAIMKARTPWELVDLALRILGGPCASWFGEGLVAACDNHIEGLHRELGLPESTGRPLDLAWDLFGVGEPADPADVTLFGVIRMVGLEDDWREALGVLRDGLVEEFYWAIVQDLMGPGQ